MMNIEWLIKFLGRIIHGTSFFGSSAERDNSCFMCFVFLCFCFIMLGSLYSTHDSSKKRERVLEKTIFLRSLLKELTDLLDYAIVQEYNYDGSLGASVKNIWIIPDCYLSIAAGIL